MTEIVLKELRQIINYIFDEIEIKSNLSNIKIEDKMDFYNDIDFNKIFDTSKELDKDSYSIGRIKDDLYFLKNIISDRNQAFPLMLVHVAPIILYIARKFSPPTQK